MSLHSPGKAFRAALSKENPLQIVGTINANHALLAQRAGYQAIYLSGGGVAAGSLGLPDLGISTLDDVLTDIRRITDVCSLPLLVDADIGFGSSAFNVARTVKSMIKAGAAGLHIEDQVGAKRCGHRPNKAIVSKEEMVDRICAAVDAKTDPDFVIMARTDALAVEGWMRQSNERRPMLKRVPRCCSRKQLPNSPCTASLPMRCRCRSLPTLLNLVPRRCLPPTNYAAPMSQWRCIPFCFPRHEPRR